MRPALKWLEQLPGLLGGEVRLRLELGDGFVPDVLREDGVVEAGDPGLDHSKGGGLGVSGDRAGEEHRSVKDGHPLRLLRLPRGQRGELLQPRLHPSSPSRELGERL